MARQSNDDDPIVESSSADSAPNPVWFKPVMIGLMLLGLVWVLVFYISGMQFPIPGIDAWNLVIGFGIAFVGFLMTTRWR
ncbi:MULTISPECIES: cell division protein CrgA [Microbacterium]|uniref:Cell division protein CrgA n=1 Tax=Microbacterium schleiferi TaxID=69362 RepID=A0ABU7V4N4_9MICO|nr:cell division protein CrgA [Microbacterium sp. 67-17]MBD3750909.1 cell division protein CrgA [Micrococcales bacterium]OJV93380.1 MAG: septation inhibitor protein [Microbacterium sp. 67-17]